MTEGRLFIFMCRNISTCLNVKSKAMLFDYKMIKIILLAARMLSFLVFSRKQNGNDLLGISNMIFIVKLN